MAKVSKVSKKKSATKSTAKKAPVAKKAIAKKSPVAAKKSAAKKAPGPAKKPAVKKTAVKKPAAKNTAANKPVLGGAAGDFVACLGKPVEAKEVKALLAALGVAKPPAIASDDFDTRVELPKLGLSLIFEVLPSRSKAPTPLTFVAVQFFNLEPGYKAFQGALPKAIAFSDTQAKLHKKLGKPEDSNKYFRWDCWSMNSLMLTVDYAKEGSIAAVAVQLPE
jgi:hypothetical protein